MTFGYSLGDAVEHTRSCSLYPLVTDVSRMVHSLVGSEEFAVFLLPTRVMGFFANVDGKRHAARNVAIGLLLLGKKS